MVNDRQPTAGAAAPTSRGPRSIGTERDAAEAFGEGSDFYLWAREFVRPPAGAPVKARPAWAQLGSVGVLALARELLADATSEPMRAPAHPSPLLIGSAAEADAAFGEGSGLGDWFREQASRTPYIIEIELVRPE